MINLLGLEEMQWRHEKGEDPFALAIEKWLRIRGFLLEKVDPTRYQEAFQCGSTKILFCLDYKNYCSLCPLVSVCHDSQSIYYQVMRHLQVYTLAGALLPRGPLIELIDFYIRDLKGYRQEWLKKSQ